MEKKIISDFKGHLHSKKYMVFHYSCSDITNFPITIGSISIFDNLIHKEIKFSRTEYTEREIILHFLDYINKKCQNEYCLIGWNVNKEIFGLQPICRRYKELTGKGHKINCAKITVFDMDEIFKEEFGDFKGGLHNLILFNNMDLDLFLFGKEEINFLAQNQFQRLDNSTMKKVRCLQKIIELYKKNKLNIKPTSIFQNFKITFILRTRNLVLFLKKYKTEIAISIIAAIIVQVLYLIVVSLSRTPLL